MKKLISLAVLFFCLFIAGCAKNDTVAVVNGTKILNSDYVENLDKALQNVKVQNPQVLQQPYAEDIIGKRILQDMIINEVFLQQAKKNNITVTKEEINEVVTKVKEQFKTDENGNEVQLTKSEQDKAFKNALKKMNISEKKYLATIENSIISEKFRREIVSKNLNYSTDEETKTFFDNVSAIYNNDKNKVEELKKTPARFDEADIVARQLKSSLAPKAKFDLVLVYATKTMTPSELLQRKQLAESIRKEIINTSNFEDVAQKYSPRKQEDKIYFSKMNVYEGMLPLELSSRAFKLNVGQTSDIFEMFKDDAQENTAQGYFIMKITEKTAGQKFTYASFEKQLENYINSKRAESLLNQTIASFVKEADIKILKKFEIDTREQTTQPEEQKKD